MPFGSLRGTNNPNNADTLLNILQHVIAVDPNTGLGNTNLASLTASGTGVERIFLESKGQRAQNAYPSLLLSRGKQSTLIAGQKVYRGVIDIQATLYNRWDKTNDYIDNVWIPLALDLERMQANLESNPTLAYQGANHAISMTFDMSGCEEELSNSSPAGITLVKVTLTIHIRQLPYDS